MFWTTVLLVHSPSPAIWLYGYVFCATVFAYNYASLQPRRLVAYAMGGLSVIYFLNISFVQKLIALFPALIWLLYYGGYRSGVGLRQFPAAKPVSIALAWSCATVLLPVSPEKWPSVVLLFVSRSAFIFALALAYDLCDLSYDKRRGLATLVLQLGPRKSLRLVYASLLVATTCTLMGATRGGYDWPMTFGLLLVLSCTAWAIRRVPEQYIWGDWRKVAIDGLMILQLVVLWLTTK